ncbi:MAG: hypothetical protein NTU69_08020 [Proteobacteria bacterium]|nr:hypothetical protein [Pseudomonadota bacterium]
MMLLTTRERGLLIGGLGALKEGLLSYDERIRKDRLVLNDATSLIEKIGSFLETIEYLQKVQL